MTPQARKKLVLEALAEQRARLAKLEALYLKTSSPLAEPLIPGLRTLLGEQISKGEELLKTLGGEDTDDE